MTTDNHPQRKDGFGELLADKIVDFVGSWRFIITQSIILTIWLVINFTGIVHFDPYPFILLNLFLSFEAAYATPIILMSTTRQAEKDRFTQNLDLKLDAETNKLMKKLHEEMDVESQVILKKIDDRFDELRELIKNQNK